jgi:hypothetical protein
LTGKTGLVLLDINHTYGADVDWLKLHRIGRVEELLKMDMLGINRTYTTGYSQNKRPFWVYGSTSH